MSNSMPATERAASATEVIQIARRSMAQNFTLGPKITAWRI
jgi:hypothetical protein